MDDRELEARLGRRLHRRFDRAEPSPELVASIERMVAAPRPRRRLSARWGAVAAALVLLTVVVVVAGPRAGLGPIGGPATTSPGTAVPTFVATSRQYIVLPAAGGEPTKAETTSAADVFDARIRAAGIGTFTSAAGYGITYQLPLDADDVVVRAALASAGDVAFVPLPAESGDGKAVPKAGDHLPPGLSALFRGDAIRSERYDGDAQSPSLAVELAPAAADAWSVYTTTHVGESFAVTLDDIVVVAPRVLEPMTSGSIVLSGSMEDERAMRVFHAVLSAGRLPDAWAHPVVPRAIDVDVAVRRAFDATTWSQVRPSVVSAELGTAGDTAGLDPYRPVWRVVLHGSFPPVSCGPRAVSSATQPPCPPPVDSALVTLDAVSRDVLSIETPAP